MACCQVKLGKSPCNRCDSGHTCGGPPKFQPSQLSVYNTAMAQKNSAPQEDYGWIREVAAVGAAGLTLPVAPLSWPVIGMAYVGSRIVFPYRKKETQRGGFRIGLLPIVALLGIGAVVFVISGRRLIHKGVTLTRKATKKKGEKK